MVRDLRKRYLTAGWLSIACGILPYLFIFLLMPGFRIVRILAFEAFLTTGYVMPAVILAIGMVGCAGPFLGFRAMVRNTASQPQRDRSEFLRGAIGLGLLLITFVFPITASLTATGLRLVMQPSSFGKRSYSMDTVLRQVDANSLQFLYEGCARYAEENAQRTLPPLAGEPGRLMYDTASLPDYLNSMAYVARSHPNQRRMALDYERWRGKYVDDWSYFYLGYDIRSDEQMAAFAQIYKQRLAAGGDFKEDLPAPAFPGGTIQRLNLRWPVLPPDAARPPLPSELAWSQIPLFIGRIEHNRNKGALILFLDGHTEFLDYPGRWPMTEKTVGLLRELDQMGRPEE